MKLFGEYDFNEIPEDRQVKIYEEVIDALNCRFGEVRNLKLWIDMEEDEPYGRIWYALVSFLEINNAAKPSLKETRTRLEGMYNAAIKLRNLGLGRDFDMKPGKIINYPEGFHDYWETFSDAWAEWAKKKGFSPRDWGPGVFSTEILRLVEVLEIAIKDVLPPKKGNKNDNYPETYSPLDLLIRHLFEFYYMYLKKKYVQTMGPMEYIDDIKRKAMGTPQDPGSFFLFVQDICKALQLGQGERPDLLRKKMYDVINKIKKTNQNVKMMKN